jgi:hypothetical protein
VFSDLKRYYGVDIRDLWRDNSTLTPRFVLWLVEHLPEDAALLASMRGGRKFRPWTTETQILAAMANLLAGANFQRAGKKMRKPIVQMPKPTRRRVAGRRISLANLPSARRVKRPL